MVDEFIQINKYLGTTDRLLILLETQDAGYYNDLTTFADTFANRLKESPFIDKVEYKISEESKKFFEEIFIKRGVVYMDENELKMIKARFSPAGMREALKKNSDLMMSPVSSAVREMILRDPLNLREFMERPLLRTGTPFSESNFDFKEGYYLSINKKAILMKITPKGIPPDIKFAEKLMNSVISLEKDVRQRLTIQGLYPDRIKASYTGGYVIALKDARNIRRDITMTITSSAIGNCILIAIGLKSLTGLIIIGFALISGMFWTFGVAKLLFGELNIITGISAAVLFGLGVDFGILYYQRYLEEKSKGNNSKDSIRLMLSATGKGTFTGALTTAVAFFILLLTGFKGISQLGLLAGIGIILCYISMSLLLPSLFVLFEKSRFLKLKYHPMTSFGIEKIGVLSIKRVRVIIFAGTLITIISVIIIFAGGFTVPFDDDVKNLRPSGEEGRILERIGRNFGLLSNPTIVAVVASSEREAIDKNDVVAKRCEELIRKGKIKNFQSLSSLIPPIKKQKDAIEVVKELNIIKIQKDFESALGEFGFKKEVFKNYIMGFKEALGSNETIGLETFKKSGGKDIIDNFISRSGNNIIIQTLIYPERRANQGEHLREIIGEVKSQDRNILVSGMDAINVELTRFAKIDFLEIFFWTLLAVAIIIFIDFRRLKPTFLILSPVIVSLLWLFGFMKFFELKFNFLNILLMPMILGMGVDYGIHILHRYEEHNDIEIATGQTGRAVVLCALTTIQGFSSLMSAQYPGLVSIGMLVAGGVALSLLTSLTLLPSLLSFFINRDIHDN